MPRALSARFVPTGHRDSEGAAADQDTDPVALVERRARAASPPSLKQKLTAHGFEARKT